MSTSSNSTEVYRIRGGGGFFLERCSDDTAKFAWTSEGSTAQQWKLVPVADGFQILSNGDGTVYLCPEDLKVDSKVICRASPASSWTFSDVKVITIGQTLSFTFRLHPVGADDDIVLDIKEASDKTAVLRKKAEGSIIQVMRAISLADNPASSSSAFHDKFFTYTVDQAKGEKWDVIIVGSGMGGGVLANDLYEQNRRLRDAKRQPKKVLLIEKGGIAFHSHCLNTSRPEGIAKGNTKPYDWFFDHFRASYDVGAVEASEAKFQGWGGGPVYTLGGRSTVWGLSSPRIHDDTLTAYFDDTVREALTNTYYPLAEDLFNIFLPATRREQQRLLERLNATADSERGVQWQWGRTAADLREDSNFVFSKGAFSPVDKLVEIAMTQSAQNGTRSYRDNFRILLDTEVQKIVWGSGDSSKVAKGVTVNSHSGPATFLLNEGGQVVLSAGSVNSPAILMRSGVKLRDMGGCRLTDHDLIYTAVPFTYPGSTGPEKLAKRMKLASTKFQTYVRLPPGAPHMALATLCIDTPLYLSKMFESPKYANKPYLLLVYLTQTFLSDDNNIVLRSDGQVDVTIKRTPHSLVYAASGQHKGLIDQIQWNALTDVASQTLRTAGDAMGLDFPEEYDLNNLKFGWSPLGGVAHELGSVPMKGKGTDTYCLKPDLSLDGYSGIYVCDNSVLPFSAEANPSLTLAALALRLSREIITPIYTQAPTGYNTFASQRTQKLDFETQSQNLDTRKQADIFGD